MTQARSRSFAWVATALLALSVAVLGCHDRAGSAATKEQGASEKAASAATPPAVAGTPRLRDLAGVDLSGTYTIAIGEGAAARSGVVKLKKAGNERYTGSAEVAGKKFSVLAHRHGTSVVGVFKPVNDGSWIGHYQVFCDRALEGTIAESESPELGAELINASAETLEGASTIRVGKNFQGRYRGTLQLAADHGALRGTYDRSDDYAGKLIATRLGDVLAVGYEFNVGTIYVWNLMISDSSAATLAGNVASRVLLPPDLFAVARWTRTPAPAAAGAAPTGGDTATFSGGDACIAVGPGGHPLEKLVAKAGGGGGSRGEDCSRYVGHYAKCGYSTCQVNLDMDSNNCGACGRSCGIGETCSSGSCVAN